MKFEIHAEHQRGWKLFRPLLEKIVEQQIEEENDVFEAFGGQVSAHGIQVSRAHYGKIELLNELVEIIDEAMKKDGR